MFKRIMNSSWFVVILAMGLGGYIRINLITRGDFPLNDGGMFYTMVQEILQNHFKLPFYTAYNGGFIPFSYPPLSFYLTALLHNLTQIPLLVLFQVLPAAFSILTIPAFYHMSFNLTKSRFQAMIAVIAFALLPRTFVWLIMGGGLSRSLGFLFGLLGIGQLIKLFENRQARFLIGSILFCTLTVLSHPEIGWFLFCSALLLFIWIGLNRHGLRNAFFTFLGVTLLTSPWWLVNLLRHSVVTLLAPFRIHQVETAPLLRLFLFSYTEEAFTDLIGAMAIIGVMAVILKRKYFLVAWLTLTVFLSLRNAPYVLMIHVALLAAIGLDQVLLPGFQQLRKSLPLQASTVADEMAPPDKISQLVLGILFLFTLLSSISFIYLPNPSLRALPKHDYRAMEWIAQNTPQSSSFAVLTGSTTWETDPVSEWFPALSHQINLTTVQGNEWFPDNRYYQIQAAYHALQRCTQKDISCLSAWEAQTRLTFTHVYIDISDEYDTLSLIPSLKNSKEYEEIYENPGVLIFRRNFAE